MLAYVTNQLRLPVFSFAVVVLSATFTISSRAQTTSTPAAQPGQPSSNSSRAAEQIGPIGSGATTEITPEGYLSTGFEEMMFFSGPDLEPTNAHIHSLDQGHPPIVHYQFDRDGIQYRFTIFAAKIDKSAIVEARRHAKFPFMPGFDIESNIYQPMVNFIRVDITNNGPGPKRAVFASGVRYADPNVAIDRRRDNPQTGEAFNRGWVNFFDDANFLPIQSRSLRISSGLCRSQLYHPQELERAEPSVRSRSDARRRWSHNTRRYRHLRTHAQARRNLDT